MRRLFLIGFSLWVTSLNAAPVQYETQMVDIAGSKRSVRLPKGYRLELLTTALEQPRLMTFAANGDLFIGSRSGKVYRLPPPYTTPQLLVTLNDYPHSVALRDGEILIAQTNGLYRAPYQVGQTKIAVEDVRLLASLPGGGGHNSRSVAIGPDKRVYLSLGIASNCSDQYLDPSYAFSNRRGGILVLREADGGASWETFASGFRNPIGFAWHPVTREMYASNNGPDHWGFDLPPEYFSRVRPGSFHGMPWFQFDGKNLQRDQCADSSPPRSASEVSLPVATFPARSAPMGMAFVANNALEPQLQGDAIVALHGSWGTPTGGGAASRRPPELVLVRFKNGVAQAVGNFLTGFQLDNGERWGRPVGVALGPDGALYFTSDSDTEGLFRLRRVR